MDPIISPRDPNEYKLIRTQNGMQVLLVSFKDSIPSYLEKGDFATSAGVILGTAELEESLLDSAALCLRSGSYQDPPNFAGLAQLVQISVGRDIQVRLSEWCSCYKTESRTDLETTFFKICSHRTLFKNALSALLEAVVKGPDTRVGAVRSAQNKIQSLRSYKLAKNENEKRRYLLSSLAREGHPLRNWTLKDCLKAKLSALGQRMGKFHGEFYSSHLMSLVIFSSSPLYLLEDWVTDLCLQVPNSKSRPGGCLTPPPPFPTPHFTRLYRVRPLNREEKNLVLTWAMFGLTHHFKQKAQDIVVFLLNYQGEGGLSQLLRQKKWALFVFVSDPRGFLLSSSHTLIEMTVALTSLGLENLPHIIKIIYEYIKNLRYTLLTPYSDNFKLIYSNLEAMGRLQYECFFPGITKPTHQNLEEIGINLFLYGPKHFLSGKHLFIEYDKDLILRCIEDLIPENMNMILYEDFDCELFPSTIVEDINLEYHGSEVPEGWLEEWSQLTFYNKFLLPTNNPLTVKDIPALGSQELEDTYPILLCNERQNKLWYKRDWSRTLLTFCSIHFISPLGRNTSQHAVLTDLYISTLNLLFKERCPYAAVSGVEVCIQRDASGVELKLVGFREQVRVVLREVLGVMNTFDLDEVLFQTVKERLMAQYHRDILNPVCLAKQLEVEIVVYNHWNSLDRYEIFPRMTKDFLMLFSKQFLMTTYMEALVMGNIEEEDALQLFNMAKDDLVRVTKLLLPVPELRVRRLPMGTSCCRVRSLRPDDGSAVLHNYYQSCQSLSICQVCLHHVMADIMNSPLVQERFLTQEHWTVHAKCTLQNNFGIYGITLSLVCVTCSKPCSCSELDQSVEDFLRDFSLHMEHLTPNFFRTFIQNNILKRRKAFSQIHREFELYRGEIQVFSYQFDRLQREIECLEKLSLRDLLGFIRAHFMYPNYRKLSIQVVGRQNKKTLRESKDITPPCLTFDNRMVNFDIANAWPTTFRKEALPMCIQSDQKFAECCLKYFSPKDPVKSKFITDIWTFKEKLELFPVTYT